jgi:hypothetical protein
MIVGTEGEIIDYRLKLPFVYLAYAKSINPGNGKGGSEQISEGASIFQKPPTNNNVERFLSMLRFDSRGNVIALTIL